MDDQLAAINRARAWAAEELEVTMALVPDISRNVRPLDAQRSRSPDWAVVNRDQGVIALGLGRPGNRQPAGSFLARSV